MSEFSFGDIDHNYAEAHQQLEQVVVNEQIIEFADGSGPLTLARLPREVLNDQRIKDAMARDGWPSLADQLIEGVEHFETSKDFIDSLKPVDGEYGPRNLYASNVMHLVGYPVINGKAEITSTESLTGLTPVVHRAHAVAPELFDNLQIVIGKMFDRFRVNGDTDYLYDELLQSQNQHVCDALHMAYKIMGRLVKVDDNEWVDRVFGHSEGDRPPILHAGTYLRSN